MHAGKEETEAASSCPLTVSQIIKYAWALDKLHDKKFGENGPSYGKWLSFKRRYRDVCKLRTAESVNRRRVAFFDGENS